MAISNVTNQPTGLPTTSASTAATSSTSSATGTTNVTTNDFLQLLVAQMKSQDPLQPMDNTQFVTQLAQFSTLQTLQQIQSSLDSSMGAQLLGQAINLIGKSVTAQPSGAAAAVTGTVQGVQLSGSDVILNLGSTTVHLSDIQQISAIPTDSSTGAGATNPASNAGSTSSVSGSNSRTSTNNASTTTGAAATTSVKKSSGG